MIADTGRREIFIEELLEDRIGSRCRMSVDPLEVAHDVELLRARPKHSSVVRNSSSRKPSSSPRSWRAARGSSVMNTAAAASR